MDYTREIEIAKKAARRAGDFALENIAAESRLKACDNSIVTDIDEKSQEMIIESLKSVFPEYGIIGEEPASENGEMLLKVPPTGDLNAWWVIDPIDGTRNFACGLPYFAVSIGLLVDGMPAGGVIYYPDRKEMYWASDVNGNAFCNDEVINAKVDTIHHNTQICVSGLLHEFWSSQQVEGVFKNCVHMNLGTAALHMAYLAAGKYSAGVFLRTKLWDVAGGAAILQAAGGKIADYYGKDLFPVNCAEYTGSQVRCLLGCESIVQEIADLIKYDK